MKFENLLTPDRLRTPLEYELGQMMLEHWDQIDSVTASQEKIKAGGEWGMTYKEISAKGQQVYVVAGMLEAHDEEGHQINDITGTPVVACIPKSKFDSDEILNFRDNDSRDKAIKRVLGNSENKKLYSMHGWGANPYAFVLPLSDMAVENDGVAVNIGLMGSMATTKKELKPLDFANKSTYEWKDIRKQALGAMYQVEGEQAFVNNYRPGFRRVILGHSMQGRTAFRLLADEFDNLPNTYFIPITPVLIGADDLSKEKARAVEYLQDIYEHVLLGHDRLGTLMGLEQKIVGRVSAEIRENLLSTVIPVIEYIISSYIGPGEPYGKDLVLFAHLLEYVANPRAVMRATHLLDASDPVMSDKTIRRMTNLMGLVTLVMAGKDRVLHPAGTKALSRYIQNLLNAPIAVKDGKIVEMSPNATSEIRKLSSLNFENDNHYLRQSSWGRINRKVSQVLAN